MTLTAVKRAEISAIVSDIKETTARLNNRGIDATDPFEVGEANDIIKRIEARIIENMQNAADDQHPHPHGQEEVVV